MKKLLAIVSILSVVVLVACSPVVQKSEDEVLTPHIESQEQSVARGVEAIKAGNLELGEKILTHFAEAGDEKIQLLLAVSLSKIEGNQVLATDRSIKWWKMLADEDNETAQFFLGSVYFHGLGVPQDIMKGTHWFEKSAKNGDAKAQYNLGVIYNNGNDVIQKDVLEAIYWFKQAAEQNYSNAEFSLCKIFDSGKQVPQNQKTAADFCLRAAVQDHVEAQFHLASMYEHGDGVEQSFEEAKKWYLRAAAAGHSIAQYNLGVFYHTGTSVLRNDIKALHWWERASEQGHVEATELVKNIYPELVVAGLEAYESGDFEKAFELLEPAALKGYPKAQTKLGRMYLAIDDARALDLLSKAAAQGNIEGMESLGVMYMKGLIVKQNLDKAVNIFARAASLGSEMGTAAIESFYPRFKVVHQSPRLILAVNERDINRQGGVVWFWLKDLRLQPSETDFFETIVKTTNVYNVADCNRGLLGIKQFDSHIVAYSGPNCATHSDPK